MRVLLLFLLLAGCATRVVPLPDSVRKTADPPFRPPEPGGKNWDWVQLTSDEWLKGEIKYLRAYTLEIDSDELDLLKFAWRKIKVLKSPRSMSVVLANQSTLRGPIAVQDDQVVVKDGAEFAVFPRPELMTIVPGGQSELSLWSGRLSFGLSVRSGNTDQIDMSAAFTLRRRAPRSRMALEYNGAFGSVNGSDTVNNQRLTGRYDLYVAPRWFVTPAAFELYRDPFQNIELRTTPLAGGGYYIFRKGVGDQAVIDWDISALAGYRYTRYVSGEDPNGTATLGMFTNIDWDITPKLELTLSYDIQVGLPDTNDTNQNLTVTLEWDVWNDFELQFGFVWNFVGDPRPEADGSTPDKNDFRMSFGIGWDF